jgi:hypothetical protein
MNSKILDNLGLGKMDSGIIIIVLAALALVSLIISLIILVKFVKLNKRYQKFMQGNTARSLEEDLVRLYEDTKYVKLSVEKNRKDIAILYEKVATAFQKIGLVKYDAFQQMGGKLSFCLALLDEEDNGFILNAVHSADGCYTYTKDVVAGESTVLLGEEEKKALEMAMSGEVRTS